MNSTARWRFVCIVGWVIGIGMAGAAVSWDASALQTVSPTDRSFPQGYEVVTDPGLTGRVIKQMPAGLAKVAAYLEVDGERYYMTDWSYDRYREGLSYHWIRPLDAAQSMTTPGGSSAGRVYHITGVAEGRVLNVRSGPGSSHNIAVELAAGAGGIRITGKPVADAEGDWVPISCEAGRGWVRQKYLAASPGPMPVADDVRPAPESRYPTPKDMMTPSETRRNVGLVAIQSLNYHSEVEYPEPVLPHPKMSSDYPYGIIIEGVEDFVESPYKEGLRIEVKGFEFGTLLRCPHSEKPFRMPKIPPAEGFEKVADTADLKLYMAGLWKIPNSSAAKAFFGDDDNYLFFGYGHDESDCWLGYSIRHTPKNITGEAVGFFTIERFEDGLVMLSLKSENPAMPPSLRHSLMLRLPAPQTKSGRFLDIKTDQGWIQAYH